MSLGLCKNNLLSRWYHTKLITKFLSFIFYTFYTSMYFMKMGSSLQIWHPSITFNVASVLAVCNSHVARFSPSSAPWVADFPVSFIFVISNIDNSMVVRWCAAWGIVKDTRIVILEIAVGINVNWVGTTNVNTISKSIDTHIMDIYKVVSRYAYNSVTGFAGET